MTPNLWLHPSFGKYLFATCDILVGVIIYRLLLKDVLPGMLSIAKDKKSTPGKSEGSSEVQVVEDMERKATLYCSLYLLNPIIFSISTRGSSESILSLMVIVTLSLCLKQRWDLAAISLGLATHWKIYPLIYGSSIISLLCGEQLQAIKYSKQTWFGQISALTISLFNRRTIRFALLSGGFFGMLNVVMYLMWVVMQIIHSSCISDTMLTIRWGYPFLYETYLYHLHRLDHRHNFSPYFYLIYLTYPSLERGSEMPNATTLWEHLIRSPLFSFVPQMSLSLGLGFIYGYDKRHLPFAWFVQTMAFVTFNKVCTSQVNILPIWPALVGWYPSVFCLVPHTPATGTPATVIRPRTRLSFAWKCFFQTPPPYTYPIGVRVSTSCLALHSLWFGIQRQLSVREVMDC